MVGKRVVMILVLMNLNMLPTHPRTNISYDNTLIILRFRTQ